MVSASAPGKVILFGEHAVVYGEPSLVAGIDKRVYVDAEKKGDRISIASDVGSSSFSLDEIGLPAQDELRYVKKAVELVFKRVDKRTGLEINITSEVPSASGLGSSASVSVATILAVSKLFDADLTLKEIAELGHRVELEVQGAASPTDSSVATFGGVLFIQPTEKKVDSIEADLSLIIGYTGVERSTKVLVERVKSLRDRYPGIVDPIIQDIGRLTREARTRLERGDDVGDLMNVNHGLLEALGVSTEQLSRAVHAARDAGARGAKLTGAGGGGCMIALAPNHQVEVTRAIEASGCSAIRASLSRAGVRIE
ncbi:MAG: mevalonate kinase [Candidatus Hydrothermarchaeales archaeon]